MCLLVVPEISSLKVPTGDPVQSHSISEWSNKGKNSKNKGEIHLPTGFRLLYGALSNIRENKI